MTYKEHLTTDESTTAIVQQPTQTRLLRRRLSRSYIIALSAIALVAILGQIVVQISIRQQQNDARIINTASRQSMLSQRIVKDMLYLQTVTDPIQRSSALGELIISLNEFQTGVNELENGTLTQNYNGDPAQIKILFQHLSTPYFNIVSAGTNVLRLVDVASPDTPVNVSLYLDPIVGQEESFLETMDAIALQYQQQAQDRVNFQRIVEFILLIAILVILLLESFLIFQPAIRQLNHSIRQIEKVNEQILRIDDIKDQFIVSVNHELRTPMMTMQGYIDLLEALHERSTPDERLTMIHRAQQASDKLIRFVQGILDIRRIDQSDDDFAPESVNVLQTVQDALALTDSSEMGATEHPIQITISPELTILGEQLRFQQVMTNLISNAMKYSPAQTPINVTARMIAVPLRTDIHRKSKTIPIRRMVEIAVQDHGLGIPTDQMTLLFNRFVRLPRDLASSTPGNGLGLYLCQKFITTMHGTIWVASTGVEGQGSTFFIRLPISA